MTPTSYRVLGPILLAGCQFGSTAAGTGSMLVGSTSEADGGTTLDSTPTAGTITTAGPGGGTGSGSSGGTADATGVDPDTSSGDSTTGEPPPALIDDGLIVRYFLDEAVSGDGPTGAFDTGPLPGVDLVLDYQNGQPVYQAFSPTSTGLTFDQVDADGGAFGPINNKIRDRIEASAKDVTMEVVLSIDDAADSADPSAIFWIGDNANNGDLALRGSVDVGFMFSFNDGYTFEWLPDLSGAPTHVIHIVADTTQPVAEDRIKFFLDGVFVPPDSGGAPSEDAVVSIPDNGRIVVGNIESGGASFIGTVFYAALYDGAFTPAQVDNNVLALLASDDTP